MKGTTTLHKSFDARDGSQPGTWIDKGCSRLDEGVVGERMDWLCCYVGEQIKSNWLRLVNCQTGSERSASHADRIR